MKFSRVNEWLSLIANLAVLVGIVFLAIEIRQNTTMMETQIHQSRAGQAMAEAQSIYNSAYVPPLLVKVGSGEDLSPEELIRFRAVFRAFNRNWDNQLRQYDAGLLEQNIPRSLRRAVSDEIASSSTAKAEWLRTKHVYSDAYAEFVDSVLASPLPEP